MIPTNNVLNPDKTKNNENFSLIEAIEGEKVSEDKIKKYIA